MPGAFTGSLLHRYYVDVSATPGQYRADVHDDEAPGGDVTRDQASMGGAWTPDDWLTGATPVLDGGPGNTLTHDVRTDGGQLPAGTRRPDDGGQGPLDQNHGGAAVPATLNMAGAAGAAMGGIVKTGSMEPRANPGGVRLGQDYTHPAERHRQGLHFNRPGLRLIRVTETNAEMRDEPGAAPRFSRGAGLRVPRLRHILRPEGQATMSAIDEVPAAAVVLDPGPIGGEWAQ